MEDADGDAESPDAADADAADADAAEVDVDAVFSALAFDDFEAM